MASTFSDLKIELIGTGEQVGTWGSTTNVNLGTALEEAIVGTASVAFSSSDVTLTLTNSNNTQAARHLRLNLTGTSGGARNLILGSGCQIDKPYIINNGLADAVTVKNTAGTGVAVPAGKSMWVYNNGTNVVEVITHTPVSSGGTGAYTLTANNVIIGNGTSAVQFVAPGTSGNVLTSNGTAWTSAVIPNLNEIVQGNSNVTVTDAGTGKIEFTVDAVEVADFTTAAVVFNESGANQDFRIEGDTQANLFVVDASADRVGIGTNTPAVLAHVQSTTATTNAVTQVLRLDSQSSGTPANGIGVGMEFVAETAADNTEIGATIEAITTDVTATSEDFDLSFKTMAAGAAAAERARIKSTGDFQFNSGFGSVGTAYGCRAWVNFDGTLSAASMIQGSGNVSSITDQGTGDYRVNFATAMPDNNYAAVMFNWSTAGTGSAFYTSNLSLNVAFVDFETRDNLGANVNFSQCNVAIFR